jgi:hypothetical protein
MNFFSIVIVAIYNWSQRAMPSVRHTIIFNDFNGDDDDDDDDATSAAHITTFHCIDIALFQLIRH